MDIDWSKAPEGATHINQFAARWIKHLGNGQHQFWNGAEWEMGFGCMDNRYIKRPEPDAWTGEGQPPVGTVCEVRADHIREGYWTEVKVLALGLHEKDVAVLVAEHSDGMVDEMHCLLYTRFEDHFRPIKTKEQIAAEERESEVSHIERCITNLKVEHQNNPRVIAEVLHNIGYRKQENNDAKA